MSERHLHINNRMMDLSKAGSHRGTSAASSQKTVHTDCDLGSGNKSIHDCLVEIDHAQNPARSPSKGSKNRLKDVYNGLVTSKELLKVMARISRHDTTGVSLFSALKFELDRACAHVAKLIQEQNQNRTEIETLFKHFQEEKALLKSRHHDKIRTAISSVKIELEKEKKLRIQTERLNKKLGKELFETKELLSKANKDLECEKRAREILEQVCDELARGIGEDKAEVEEIKRQSARVCEEVEKEREMLQVADSLREERVQMKLLEAKYQFEEKNAIVDELRHELESYLKSKKGEEGETSSPSYDKIRELQRYLHETLPCTYKYEDKGKDDIKIVNKFKNEDDEDEEDDDDDDDDGDSDSGDSDLHSIELNVDDVSKSFKWGDAVRNRRSRRIRKPVREWEFSSSRENGEDLDEIERYNMIKDLRDHIVSGSKMSSTLDSVSPSRNELGRVGVVCSKDQNGVICHG